MVGSTERGRTGGRDGCLPVLENMTDAVSSPHEVWSQLGKTNSREAIIISRIDSVPKKEAWHLIEKLPWRPT